jgi:hypothetical protein
VTFAGHRAWDFYDSEKNQVILVDFEGGVNALNVGATIAVRKYMRKEKFEAPPKPYHASDVVKELERRGIGRPSTWSNIISVLETRDYIVSHKWKGEKRSVEVVTMTPSKTGNPTSSVKEKEETFNSYPQSFWVTDLGEKACDFLCENLANLVDYNFTNELEKDLDKIMKGDASMASTLSEFYKKLKAIETMKISPPPPVKTTNWIRVLDEDEDGTRIGLLTTKKGDVVFVKAYVDKEKKWDFASTEGVDLSNVSLEVAKEHLVKKDNHQSIVRKMTEKIDIRKRKDGSLYIMRKEARGKPPTFVSISDTVKVEALTVKSCKEIIKMHTASRKKKRK